MSNTSCHFLAGGSGSASFLNGVGRIQDGVEGVAVSDRKRMQAEAICSAICVADGSSTSDAMSACRSLRTASSAPRQTWCCVTCGQTVSRTLFRRCADTPSTSQTRVSELSDIPFIFGGGWPRLAAAAAATNPAASASNRVRAGHEGARGAVPRKARRVLDAVE
nr:unnamed protein product [Digitaria exilis]